MIMVTAVVRSRAWFPRRLDILPIVQQILWRSSSIHKSVTLAHGDHVWYSLPIFRFRPRIDGELSAGDHHPGRRWHLVAVGRYRSVSWDGTELHRVASVPV
jgi:hypothetical protein